MQTSGSEYSPPRSPSIPLIVIHRRTAVFRLPAELIIDILSHYEDPRRNILREKSSRGSGVLLAEHVERSTAIRKLTMTCWHLRNMLFPLLWEHLEGCTLFNHIPHYDNHWVKRDTLNNGLHAQCSYLIRNPTICPYVEYVCSTSTHRTTHEMSFPRTISADLLFTDATEDLMTIFVDCLILLPNLRTLEVFSTNRSVSVEKELERECARFPSIRELWVDGRLGLVRNCPNVESVTVMDGFSRAIEMLCSHGKRVRRVAGVDVLNIRRGKLRYVLVGGACSPSWKSRRAVRTSRRSPSRISATHLW